MLKPALHREEGWLLYAAAVPASGPHVQERLLAWSRDLPGGCKFAHSAAAELRVQAELSAPAECAERVAAVAAGFAAAAVQLGLAPARIRRRAKPCTAPTPDLASLCGDAGWSFEERSDASLVVDLAVPGTYMPALIEARPGCVALEAELARLPDVDGPCRAALVALLLRVNGAFRLVRAVLAPESRALLAVTLPRTTSAAELGEAISALAVAARNSALEARLVAADAALARAYLEWCGMTPPD